MRSSRHPSSSPVRNRPANSDMIGTTDPRFSDPRLRYARTWAGIFCKLAVGVCLLATLVWAIVYPTLLNLDNLAHSKTAALHWWIVCLLVASLGGLGLLSDPARLLPSVLDLAEYGLSLSSDLRAEAGKIPSQSDDSTILEAEASEISEIVGHFQGGTLTPKHLSNSTLMSSWGARTRGRFPSLACRVEFFRWYCANR